MVRENICSYFIQRVQSPKSFMQASLIQPSTDLSPKSSSVWHGWFVDIVNIEAENVGVALTFFLLLEKQHRVFFLYYFSLLRR